MPALQKIKDLFSQQQQGTQQWQQNAAAAQPASGNDPNVSALTQGMANTVKSGTDMSKDFLQMLHRQLLSMMGGQQ